MHKLEKDMVTLLQIRLRNTESNPIGDEELKGLRGLLEGHGLKTNTPADFVMGADYFFSSRKENHVSVDYQTYPQSGDPRLSSHLTISLSLDYFLVKTGNFKFLHPLYHNLIRWAYLDMKHHSPEKLSLLTSSGLVGWMDSKF